MDQLEQYRKRGLNDYQMQEVKNGFLNGLTIQQVDAYAWSKFDSMQMKEVRLGYETGLSDSQVRTYASPSIDADEMERMRLEIDMDAKVSETRKTELHQKHLKNILLVVLIFSGGIASVFIGFLLAGSLNAWLQPLDIKLSADSVEIEYGTEFVPMTFVSSYTQDDGAELILPEQIDTKVLGEKKILYKIRNSRKTVARELTVYIVDSTPPKLILNKKEISLIRTVDDFHYEDYIEEASDNVDGNLRDKVTASELDASKEEQMIIYSISDSSGNISTAELKVTLTDPVIASPAPSSPSLVPSSQSSSSSQGEQSSTTQNQVPNGTRAGEIKNYWFTDGYDIDTAYNACKVDGSAYGSYSCEPIMVNGLYTGYKLTYK